MQGCPHSPRLGWASTALSKPPAGTGISSAIGQCPTSSLPPTSSFPTPRSKTFYTRWEARYKGSDNAHRPAIASFVKDVKTLGLNHQEMSFIEGLRWSLEEVARVYGVPPPLVGSYENATLNNIATAERLLWRNTIVPELGFLEQAVSKQLLPKLGYPELSCSFEIRRIEALQEDAGLRADRESKLTERGILTINEIRQERQLPDVPWGNVWWAPNKVAPANTRGSKPTDGDTPPDPA